MEPEDLSIGLEAWARPGLGLKELLQAVARGDAATWERENDVSFHAFLALWRKVGACSMLGPAKGYMIYRLARRAAELPGDFIECGAYRGGTSFLLALMLEAAFSEKSVILCDSWAGLPRPDRSVDRAYEEGSMACSEADVCAEADRLGVAARCLFAKGPFSESLPRLPSNASFAFAHVDCDLYRSTQEALEYVVPRLSAGAPLVLDDYYDESHGVMTAANEMAERLGMVIHLAPWGQAFAIKGELPSSIRPTTIGRHRVHLTTDAIRGEQLFLPYLEAIAAVLEEKSTRLRRFVSFCRETPAASPPLRAEPPAPESAWMSYAFKRTRGRRYPGSISGKT